MRAYILQTSRAEQNHTRTHTQKSKIIYAQYLLKCLRIASWLSSRSERTMGFIKSWANFKFPLEEIKAIWVARLFKIAPLSIVFFFLHKSTTFYIRFIYTLQCYYSQCRLFFKFSFKQKNKTRLLKRKHLFITS